MRTTIDPADVLQSQIATLRQELFRSRDAAKAVGVEASLRERVAGRFDVELMRLVDRVDALTAAIDAGEHLPEAAWRAWRGVQAEAAPLLDECLAFLQGALARQAGLDAGICALTDLLLADLAAAADIAWGRFTLLATSEFYRDTAEVIRIRYPESGVWSMPFAAHELGHFVSAVLSGRRAGGYVYPFQAYLDAEAERTPGDGQAHSKQWHHLQETFADVYATCTLGPAYAAAFIVLRTNPAEAHLDAYSHPSTAARVHSILWTLDKADETYVARHMQGLTTRLRDLWTGSLRRVGQPETLPDAAAARAEQLASDSFQLLAGTTPRAAMFDAAGWHRCQAVSLDPPPTRPEPPTSRRDVLNAAWLARLDVAGQNPYAVNDLGQLALAAFRSVR